MKKYNPIILYCSVFLICCKDIRKEYYENGTLKSEFEFNGDALNGLCKSYFENGALESEKNFVNDVENGKAVWYFQNGNVRIESYFVEGKLQGISKEYFESGKLKIEANFKNGNQNGLTKTWFESGEKETEMNFENGVEHGEFRSFFKNGNKEMDAIFEEDSVIFYIEYDENGEWNTEYRGVEVSHNSDTIELGEKFKSVFKLQGPIPKENVMLTMNIHFYEDPSKFSLPQSFSDINNNEIEYSFTPKILGKHEYVGFFFIDSKGENERKYQVPNGTFWVIENKESSAIN